MRVSHIDKMKRGWFVGNFDPTLYKTADVEVAVKRYSAGDAEKAHYHKIATEITVVTRGRIKMNGKEYKEGDIIIIEPGETTDFAALTDVETTVVKIPGAENDKYLA